MGKSRLKMAAFSSATTAVEMNDNHFRCTQAARVMATLGGLTLRRLTRPVPARLG